MGAVKTAFFLMFMGAVLAGAQTLDPNTITVTASRTTNVPTEQVQYTLNFNASPDLDAAAVQSALAKAGLTGLTLSGSGSNASWTYTGTVAYSKLSDQIKLLTAAGTALAPSIMLNWTLGPSGVSDTTVLDIQRKLLPDLLADARKRATALADAAGLTIGNLLAIADTNTATNGAYAANSVSATVDVTASLTVKFAALRYN